MRLVRCETLYRAGNAGARTAELCLTLNMALAINMLQVFQLLSEEMGENPKVLPVIWLLVEAEDALLQ